MWYHSQIKLYWPLWRFPQRLKFSVSLSGPSLLLQPPSSQKSSAGQFSVLSDRINLIRTSKRKSNLPPLKKYFQFFFLFLCLNFTWRLPCGSLIYFPENSVVLHDQYGRGGHCAGNWRLAFYNPKFRLKYLYESCWSEMTGQPLPGSDWWWEIVLFVTTLSFRDFPSDCCVELRCTNLLYFQVKFFF